MPPSTTLGAIDAGSNGIRVLIAAVSEGHVETLATERMPVRLGSGTFSTGSLQDKSIEGAVESFKRFRQLFERYQVTTYRAVATSAVRSASNRERLIDAIYKETGIELEVIDGAEEARLSRRAVLERFGKRRAPDAIFDLGGGSLEMMRKRGRTWISHSTKIGTVRLLEAFGIKGSIGESDRKMLQRFSRTSLRNMLGNMLGDKLKSEEIQSTAFCGGNAECLSELFGERDSSGMWSLNKKRLREARNEISKLDVKERMNKYKVRKDRAEVMGIAAVVIDVVCEEFSVSSYWAPNVGIRDGILLDLAEAEVGKLVPGKTSPCLAAARSFAARLGHNSDHADHVRMIAHRLFDELQELHKLPKRYSLILQVAALLHDVGEVVNRKSHHKHSEYLIMNGRIPGLDSVDRAVVAATARAHRKSIPSARKHEVFGSLDKTLQARVLKMSALLRIADMLDASRKRRTVALTAKINDDRVLLTIATKKGIGPMVDHLRVCSSDFKKVFGLRLVLDWEHISEAARAL